MQTETIIMASKILSKCGIFWVKMAAEVEAFHINLFTTKYGEAVPSAGRAE